ncbi:MAG: ABC transporter substrate-binding protein [Hyphomonadaceae bacterium]|nr:ABC transporter substrate-binding protein [Hyphomonadaceae bacterium]
MLTRRATALGAIAACVPAGAAHATPIRVVSLNPCLDTILVHVADRSQIAALSHYAREPGASTIADIARTLPFTYESAEEIVALRPSLVLASHHSGLATRQALARLGVEVATYGVPDSVEASIAQIADVARRVGRQQNAATLIERIRARLAEAERGATRRPIKALVFQARGLVAGEGTLADELMRRIGFDNVAARYGVHQWGNAPLELLIADPPELLLAGSAAPGAPTSAERMLSHPALASIAPRMRRADFPAACLYCGGPVLLQTTRVLAAARDAFWAGR